MLFIIIYFLFLYFDFFNLAILNAELMLAKVDEVLYDVTRFWRRMVTTG